MVRRIRRTRRGRGGARPATNGRVTLISKQVNSYGPIQIQKNRQLLSVPSLGADHKIRRFVRVKVEMGVNETTLTIANIHAALPANVTHVVVYGGRVFGVGAQNTTGGGSIPVFRTMCPYVMRVELSSRYGEGYDFTFEDSGNLSGIASVAWVQPISGRLIISPGESGSVLRVTFLPVGSGGTISAGVMVDLDLEFILPIGVIPTASSFTEPSYSAPPSTLGDDEIQRLQSLTLDEHEPHVGPCCLGN